MLTKFLPEMNKINHLPENQSQPIALSFFLWCALVSEQTSSLQAQQTLCAGMQSINRPTKDTGSYVADSFALSSLLASAFTRHTRKRTWCTAHMQHQTALRTTPQSRKAPCTSSCGWWRDEVWTWAGPPHLCTQPAAVQRPWAVETTSNKVGRVTLEHGSWVWKNFKTNDVDIWSIGTPQKSRALILSQSLQKRFKTVEIQSVFEFSHAGWGSRSVV